MGPWCREFCLTSPTSESPKPGQALEPKLFSSAPHTSGTQLEERGLEKNIRGPCMEKGGVGEREG